MKAIKEWNTTIDGKDYHFAYERTGGKTHIVKVNDYPIEIRERFLSILMGFDEKF